MFSLVFEEFILFFCIPAVPHSSSLLSLIRIENNSIDTISLLLFYYSLPFFIIFIFHTHLSLFAFFFFLWKVWKYCLFSPSFLLTFYSNILLIFYSPFFSFLVSCFFSSFLFIYFSSSSLLFFLHLFRFYYHILISHLILPYPLSTMSDDRSMKWEILMIH